MPVSIVFNQIAVNSVSQNAGITTGQNNLNDWNWQGKNNIAAGVPIGLSAITGNLNIIFDNDVVDIPVSNPDFINPQASIQT